LKELPKISFNTRCERFEEFANRYAVIKERVTRLLTGFRVPSLRKLGHKIEEILEPCFFLSVSGVICIPYSVYTLTSTGRGDYHWNVGWKGGILIPLLNRKGKQFSIEFETLRMRRIWKTEKMVALPFSREIIEALDDAVENFRIGRLLRGQ